jgi:hypothetical protein
LVSVFGVGEFAIEWYPDTHSFTINLGGKIHTEGIDRAHGGCLGGGGFAVDVGVGEDCGGVIVVHVFADAIADCWSNGICHNLVVEGLKIYLDRTANNRYLSCGAK